MTLAPDEAPGPRSRRVLRLADSFGTLQGIVTGVITGVVLWVALAWGVLVLLRGIRL